MRIVMLSACALTALFGCSKPKPVAELQTLDVSKPEAGAVYVSGNLVDAQFRGTRSEGTIEVVFRDRGKELCRLKVALTDDSYSDADSEFFSMQVPWPCGALTPSPTIQMERAFLAKDGTRFVDQGTSGPYLKAPSWLTPKRKPAPSRTRLLWTSLMDTFRAMDAPVGKSPPCRLQALEAATLDPVTSRAVPQNVLRVNASILRRLANGEKPRLVDTKPLTDDAIQSGQFTNGDLQKMIDGHLVRHQRYRLDRKERDRLSQTGRYVLAVFPTKLIQPVQVQRGSATRTRNGEVVSEGRAGRFVMGEFQGVAAVVDRREKRAVCWQTFRATSSTKVEAATKYISLDEVRRLDLVRNARKSAQNAFQALAPKLVAAAREKPDPFKAP